MTLRLLVSLFIGMAWAFQLSRADSIGPYWDRRVAPPESDAYVVVETMPGDGGEGLGPVKIQIVKQPDHERRPPAITRWFSDADGQRGPSVLELVASRDVATQRGDRVTGEMLLDVPPMKVLLSPSGAAVAFLGRYGIRREGANDEIVVLADGSGQIVAQLRLAELFGHRMASTYSSGEWQRKYPQLSGWIDESNRNLVIVAEASSELLDPCIATVHLNDGSIRRGSRQDVLRSITPANLAGLDAALTLSNEMGLDVPACRLIDIFNRQDLKESTRVVAGAMLANMGDVRGGRLIQSLAKRALTELEADPSLDLKMHWLPMLAQLIGDHGPSDDYTAMALAVRYLPNVTGARSISTLAKIGGRSRLSLRDTSQDAAVLLGVAALPELSRVIRETTDNRDRRWAQRVVRRIEGNEARQSNDQ